jgi:hypothetical protein
MCVLERFGKMRTLTESSSSDYSLAQSSVLSPSSTGMFSYYATGPGASWDATADVPQTFSEFSDHGDYYNPDPEDYVHLGHNTPRMDVPDATDNLRGKWTAASAADNKPTKVSKAAKPSKAPKAEAMRRAISKDSSGSHKHRTVKASSKKTRSRVHSVVSESSSHYSGLDVTGNAPAFDDAGLGNDNLMDPHQYLSQDLDTLSVSSHMSPQVFGSGIMGLTPGPTLTYSADMEYSISQHVDPSATQIFDPVPGNSPHSFESRSSISRASSPGFPDDMWSAVPVGASPSETYGSSPEMVGHSLG